jgi:hypothetical protein
MFIHPVSGALLSFALVTVSASAAEESIDSCGTEITKPGRYHISKDLTCASGPYAIDIEASNVELHFDGHTLTGGGIGTTGSGVTVGISSGISHVNIVGNGTVTGFGGGGIVVGGINSFIFNVRVSGMAARNNRVGITLYQTIDSALTSNVASNNITTGIELAALSLSDVLDANQTDGNGAYGIEIKSGSTDSLFQANEAHGNLVLDFFESAIWPPACLNTWKSNQFRAASPSCIQ